MTETATNYNVDAIASELTELEQLNLKVAAIAGWENIEEWSPNPKTRKPKRTFTGTNKKHPELGIFVPDYTGDLNAIADLVNRFCFIDGRIYKVTFEPSDPEYGSLGEFRVFSEDIHRKYEAFGISMALALCAFLLELHPYLILHPEAIAAFEKISKPETKPEVIEATFG
jgi:hypothetical protein